MERWRWVPDDLGDFHVLVNMPEFRLFVENGNDGDGYEVAYTTRVVIGTPKNQTPVFSDEIEHIVVNPYWNVPASIATQRDRAAPAGQPRLPRQPEHGAAVGRQGGQRRGGRLVVDQRQQLPHPPAPGRRQCAGQDQVPVPQPARRLSARHAVEVAVRRAPSAPTATAACGCRTRWSSPRRCSRTSPS